MNKMKALLRVVIIVLLFCSYTMLYSQSVAMTDWEAEAVRFEQMLDSLRVRHARLMGQAEIVAQRITLYRDKDNLNAREHGNLEKQLRESQRFEYQIRDMESQINVILQEYKETIETLIPLYQATIDSLLVQADHEDHANKEELLRRIQDLLDKKQFRESQLIAPYKFVHAGYRIDAQSGDTVRQLRMKAGLLLDQEEALRNEIDMVNGRINSLNKEKQIRTRMAELADDLDIFNEREELVGRQSEDMEDVLNNLDYWRVTFNDERAPQSLASPQDWQPEPSERTLDRPEDMLFTPRSPAHIEDSIERLERFRDRLAQEADSLQQRAEWFSNEAESKRE
jgi:hypothetical protein